MTPSATRWATTNRRWSRQQPRSSLAAPIGRASLGLRHPREPKGSLRYTVGAGISRRADEGLRPVDVRRVDRGALHRPVPCRARAGCRRQQGHTSSLPPGPPSRRRSRMRWRHRRGSSVRRQGDGRSRPAGSTAAHDVVPPTYLPVPVGQFPASTIADSRRPGSPNPSPAPPSLRSSDPEVDVDSSAARRSPGAPVDAGIELASRTTARGTRSQGPRWSTLRQGFGDVARGRVA